MSKEVVKKRVRRVKKEDTSHKENQYQDKSLNHKEHQKISRDDKLQPKRRDKEKEKRTERILRIIMAVIGLIILLIGIYVSVNHFSSSNKIVKKLAEGNAYLDNQEYENAIEIYKEALELNPDSTEIKSHISNVYVLIAQTMGETDEAIAVYQTALTYNIGNVSAYWGVANIFGNRGDEANMISALTTGYTNSGDVNMGAKLDAIQAEKDRIQAEADALAAEQAAEEAKRVAQEEANNQLLQPLLELFQKEDMDGIKELIRDEAYVTMSDELINADDVYYCGEKDADGNKNGKGVGAYANGYYFYGDYSENMRSGSGIWIRAVYSESSSIGSFIFEGEWESDLPNGSGSATSNFYKDKIGSSELVKQVITGVYANGLENGKMSLAGTTKGGTGVKYSYTSENGVAKKISDEDSGAKGQYIIAQSSDRKSNLTSDGSSRGVEGFIE